MCSVHREDHLYNDKDNALFAISKDENEKRHSPFISARFCSLTSWFHLVFASVILESDILRAPLLSLGYWSVSKAVSIGSNRSRLPRLSFFVDRSRREDDDRRIKLPMTRWEIKLIFAEVYSATVWLKWLLFTCSTTFTHHKTDSKDSPPG